MLSDTATEMFIERGFDAVRVAQVAESCGVSEKTVYNYFPTKESLLLDRWDSTMASLRIGLADHDVSPIQTALEILADELSAVTSWLAAQADVVTAIALFQRFGALIGGTPALRAHQREMTDLLVTAVAEILAERTHTGVDDPEPQISAIALVGLWQVQFQSLKKHLNDSPNPERIHQAVMSDTERAASLIESGIGTVAREVASQ
jgi:AcrR family transcriptional regulator